MARRRLSIPGAAAIAAFTACFAAATPASAQTNEATRAAARQLATEGVNNFEAGEFAAASDKLNRAFETIRAPSLGLWSARALARCGRLVQASERYLEVTRLDPRNGDEDVQRQAKQDALREYDELQPRIARLTLAVFNASADQSLEVFLDGVALPAPLLRAQVPVDPGAHEIEVRQGERTASQPLRVKEGARVNISLQLPPLPHPRAITDTTRGKGATGIMAPSEPSAADPLKRKAPVALWLSLAGAGAGLTVGTISGVMALQAREPLAPNCPQDVCDPKYAADVKRLNTLRTVSTVSFTAGGLGLVTAAVLWLSGRPVEPSAQRYVRPSIGLNQVRLEGRF